jgi:hypothetical protein
MGLARSTFYDEPENQPIRQARLVEQIKAVCAEWPAYGYRRVTAELHGEGRLVNHKKVMRLMKENGLTVRPRRRFVATTDSNHDGPIFPNLAENIVPTNRNQLWVADITPAFAGAGSTSLSRPASFISLRSSTLGHGELSAMRSASGSMHVWHLPHVAASLTLAAYRLPPDAAKSQVPFRPAVCILLMLSVLRERGPPVPIPKTSPNVPPRGVGTITSALRRWFYGNVLTATTISPLTIASVKVPSANAAITRSATVSSGS